MTRTRTREHRRSLMYSLQFQATIRGVGERASTSTCAYVVCVGWTRRSVCARERAARAVARARAHRSRRPRRRARRAVPSPLPLLSSSLVHLLRLRLILLLMHSCGSSTCSRCFTRCALQREPHNLLGHLHTRTHVYTSTRALWMSLNLLCSVIAAAIRAYRRVGDAAMVLLAAGPTGVLPADCSALTAFSRAQDYSYNIICT